MINSPENQDNVIAIWRKMRDVNTQVVPNAFIMSLGDYIICFNFSDISFSEFFLGKSVISLFVSLAISSLLSQSEFFF